jgi:hypothetical protein
MFTKVLTLYQLNWTPQQSFFIPLPSVLEVSTGFIFPFSYMNTQYFHHIHPPTPFPYILSHPTSATPQTGPLVTSYSPFFDKRHFCLFKIAIQGVSFWYFHVYTYYKTNWFIPSTFLLSTSVPLFAYFRIFKNSM